MAAFDGTVNKMSWIDQVISSAYKLKEFFGKYVSTDSNLH